MPPLLPVEEAQALLLDPVGPLPARTLPLAAAAGRILAADLSARLDQPPADMSAMDGYALRAADLPGPLAIVGEAAAGHAYPHPLREGEAVRIFTGAPLPAGADAVLIQEEATAEAGRLSPGADALLSAGAHVRRRAADFAKGTTVLRAGDRLTAPRIGLAAAAGYGEVPVIRLAEVALLATGDELVPPGAMPGPGQIVSSNSAMLLALMSEVGAQVRDCGIIPDRAEALAEALARVGAPDVLVTIGGASVGDHDLVHAALTAAGARLDFWKLAMRPGKPIMAGRLGSTTVVGLPGNPVAAYVGALLFVVPLLRRLMGERQTVPQPGHAVTTVPLPANGPRRAYLRSTLTADGGITPAADQDSSFLSVLAGADALLIRPERAPALPAGSRVPCIRLSGS